MDDLRCKIHYIINIRDLQKYGHEFKAGDIIPECNFAEAKQVYRSNGNLWKGLRITKTLNGENKINAPGVDGKKYSYGDFICKGNVQLITVIDSQSGKIVAGPDIHARGFAEEAELFAEVKVDIERALLKAVQDGVNGTHQLSQVVRRTIGEWVGKKHRRRPMIVPVVIEV